jgi:hypothetical protein
MIQELRENEVGEECDFYERTGNPGSMLLSRKSL